jgi:hypothetical protein
MRQTTTAGVRHDEGKAKSFMRPRREPIDSAARGTHRGLGLFAMDAQKPDNGAHL